MSAGQAPPTRHGRVVSLMANTVRPWGIMQNKTSTSRVACLLMTSRTEIARGSPKAIAAASLTPAGRLAQLARASRLHREGRGFKSLNAHRKSHMYTLDAIGVEGVSVFIGEESLK